MPDNTPELMRELQEWLKEVQHQLYKNLKVYGEDIQWQHDAESYCMFHMQTKVWLYNPYRKQGLLPKLISN